MYGYISNRYVWIKVADLILTLRSSFLCKGLTVLKSLHKMIIKSIQNQTIRQLIELQASF